MIINPKCDISKKGAHTMRVLSVLSAITFNYTEPIVLGSESRFTLPIFPLRKRVRVPTDELKLNLYEERYLSMSEYILFQQDLPFFGALFSSDKPQLVAKGSSPVVPMLDIGDFGVLCLVHDWFEGKVPTGSGDLRRRIRLNAIGIGRFRIENILHDGTGSTTSFPIGPTTDDASKSLPFILVEASFVFDNYDVVDVDDSKQITLLEAELQTALEMGQEDEYQKDTSAMEDKIDDDSSSTSTEVERHHTDIVDRVCSMIPVARSKGES
jgi:hypothetical protein